MELGEYEEVRETWLPTWRTCYERMLLVPAAAEMELTPEVEAFFEGGGGNWYGLDWYGKWIAALYGDEVVKRFGKLEVVDPTLIPVGMVQLFRKSRMKLDE